MNLTKKILTTIAICILTFSLVACEKKQTIVGTWDYSSSSSSTTSPDEYVFHKNNTGTYTVSGLEPIDFTYTAKEDTVTITMTILGVEKSQDYQYRFEDSKLIFKINGVDRVYTKK